MNDQPLPTLYSFRRCPYAMRARMAILKSKLQVEIREVVLRDKPASMLEASPKGSVPVLILNEGTILEESLDIALHVLNQNDPDNILNGNNQLFEDLISENDGYFKKALDRYKYPSRYPDEDTSKARDIGEKFLDRLNRLLSETGYLNGSKLSITDICIFPFIRQFANTDREWFDGLPYSALQKWLEECLDSDLFKKCMIKHPQWREGDAPLLFGAS